VARISYLLSKFVDSRGLGVVYTGDTGFVLARQPDTVRGPDVAFLSNERERDAPRVLASTDLLEGEDVLPGFSVTVAEIFQT
jgi:Uma2 family endonuclease